MFRATQHLCRPSIARAITTIASAMVLAGCSPSAKVRYRVTVELNDNGKIRSGSSVWEFELAKSILPLANIYNAHFRGEAVAVEIPGRGILFVLTDRGEMYPENLFGDLQRSSPKPPRFSDRFDDLKHIQEMTGATAKLDCENPSWIGVACPSFIRFRDLNNPMTLEQVNFSGNNDNFGRGVNINQVTVQITDDKITSRLSGILPWLDSDLKKYRRDLENPFTSALPREIGNLRRGTK
jgi:hypothetical protein